jgi:tetratricopeptide (TPR) repeat protein
MSARKVRQSKSLLPLWKKVLFSIVTTVLFFAVLELVLKIAGVRTLLYDDDPYVGFASNIPLFVEGRDGEMVTAPNKIRWFNEQSFAKLKPSDVTRVFCVGGSTTYGRPYSGETSFCSWLQEYVSAADPSRKWEVVNAGGISYASYRVAKVMEELIEYEPDLFVIYSGHNEFLEERTYSGIINTPGTVRGLQGALSHTRTYSFMAKLLRPDRASGGEAGTPVLGSEVNTILDQSAGLDRYQRDPELKRKILAHYRYNLARMVDIANSGGAKVIFVTPAANLRSSSPFKSEHPVGLSEKEKDLWQAHKREAEKKFEQKRYDEALAEMEQAMEIDGEHAHAHFLRAQLLQALGRMDDANHSYVAALESDVCPLRILPAMRDILSETAASRGVPVFDYHSFLVERSENGLPGDDWFLDHVHPTIEGHRFLALELITVMEENGMLAGKNALTEISIQEIKGRVLAGIDDEARGIALRNLGNVLNWAGKKREAYHAATKALALAPGDAYAHYLVGDLAGFLGKTSEAEERFRELTSFSLDPKEAPYFADAHYQLAQIIGERGETAESVRLLMRTIELQPGHKGALETLPLLLQSHGTGLLKKGRNAEAADAFRKLEELTPGNSMAANLLGAALIQGKNFPGAIEVLTRAVAKDESNPSLHNNLASAYAQSDRAEDAIRHFKLAINYKPNHVGAHLNLARLLEKTGNRDQAARHYQSVLDIDPNSAEGLSGLKRTKRQP